MNKRGFTLIELLIVVAIIAILAAIAVPNFLEAQTRAKVSRVKADFRAIALAMEVYRTDENDYPSGYIDTDFNSLIGRPEWQENFKRLTTPLAYMVALPAENPFGAWLGNHLGPVKEKGYRILGGEICREIMAGEAAGGTVHPSWANANFVIWSIGPSSQQTYGSDPDFNYMMVYDPTNGTVSAGHIFFVSGPLTTYHSFN